MWKVFFLNNRSFHTSLYLYAKIGKVMKKVMERNSKKKRIFSESQVLPSAEMFSKGGYEGRYSRNARRVSVLNKLFMKYITDLLMTGEYSPEFIKLGIEINRVQVSPDYNGLNVFWVAKGTEQDETIDKLLKKNAGFLRHELSSLRVIGNVPIIYFVKDRKYSQIMEVDTRLAVADFGEDHTPMELSDKLKNQLELYTQLPSDIQEKIQKLDAELPDDCPIEEEESLPPMPQNVLGLDHSSILNRITRNMKKSQALHRVNNNETEISHSVNENPIQFGGSKERRAAFKEFLQKRELLRSKARREEKKYYPDLQYMREEFEERRAEHFKNFQFYDEEDDYNSDHVEEDEREM